MPLLSELNGEFLKINDDRSMSAVATIDQAQGVMFLCPLCFRNNRGPVGTHSIICWFANRGVPDDASPKPGRWIPAGAGIDDLSFVGPGAASVQLIGGCGWHGFVTHGNAE